MKYLFLSTIFLSTILCTASNDEQVEINFIRAERARIKNKVKAIVAQVINNPAPNTASYSVSKRVGGFVSNDND